MPQALQAVFEPRKSPLQARSTATVDAILQATIQVLLSVGKQRLTTTRVAARAGASVGTLYQYFPNKSALLQAALKRHLDQVADAIEQACREQQGASLQQMATALVTAFLQAKMTDVKTSAALYSVSSDVDGAKIVAQMGARMNRLIAEMLTTAKQPLIVDPQVVASVLQGAMVGVSRRILESAMPEKTLAVFRPQLITLVQAYLSTCAVSENNQAPGTTQPGA